jgi:hypothetical protein
VPGQAELAALAAAPQLLPQHGKLAWKALSERAPGLDQAALQEQLKAEQFFTAQLDAKHPGRPERAVTDICHLLRLAYGERLSGPAAERILDGCAGAPPPALLAAVLISADLSDRSRSRLGRTLRQAVAG